MSTILLAVHDGIGTVLAQEPTTPVFAPEAPPLSDKYLQLVRYLTWFLVLLIPVVVVILVIVLVRASRRRSTEPGSHLNWTPQNPGAGVDPSHPNSEPPGSADITPEPEAAQPDPVFRQNPQGVPHNPTPARHIPGAVHRTAGTPPPNPIVPPPGSAPTHEIPGPDGWGPPDPTVWGRPNQR
ncbi:hypothetical protein ACFVVM_07285 [Nocardia sp. NPDC058176]|uniref:hypothetical protein n=1 Tax=Nocardia sp. NPDC058176 TaxID=3346368 RepID=UPI0036D9E2F6